MRQLLVRLVAVALVLGASACDGDGGPKFIWFRAMHAMSDGPGLRVDVENYVYTRDIIYGISAGEGGDSLLSSSPPTARLTATYLAPGATSRETLLSMDVPVEEDFTSTVIFTGTFDDPQTLTVVSQRLARPLAAINVQFAHAALDLGPLDVYVTAPETELTATAPIATVQPRGHTEILEIPFGTSRFRLTPAGALDVIMDSGELEFPEVEGSTGPGMQWLYTIAPSVVPGPSPVFLIGSTGRQTFRFLDVGTPATVRAVNASPDALPADFVVVAEPNITLFSGLAHRERTPQLASPLGDVQLGFTETGGDGTLLASDTEELAAGQEALVFLIGAAADADILRNNSLGRSVATEAKLRFANVAPDSKFFSIYLTRTEDETRDINTRIVRDLRFGVSSDHLARAPGDYFLSVTERFYGEDDNPADAEETLVFGPTPLELVGGDVFTYAFFAPDNEGEAEVLLTFDDRLP